MLSKLLLAFLLCSPALAQSTPERAQILWQRTLEDALAIAQAEQRPLLIAVNMDGESASEQIVRSRYRDPKFVEPTRSLVCLVASYFRHTPRDYDEQGRRIVCPRLGEITCGEHIALEPILFDKYLGKERIAPRHAVIQLDGTQTFDLFQLFDLRELDEAIAAAAAQAPPPTSAPAVLSESALATALATSKQNHMRTAFEGWIAENDGDADWNRTLDLLREHGDAGSIGALRILTARLIGQARAPATHARVAELRQLADEIGARKELGTFVIDRLTGLGKFPGSPDLGDDIVVHGLVPDDVSAADRTRVIGCGLTHAHEFLDDGLLARLDSERVDGRSMLANAPSTAWILVFARWVREQGKVAPRAQDPLPPADELERALGRIETELNAKPKDAELQAKFGRTSLALARRKIEAQARDTQFFLEDAYKWLTQASAARPKDVRLALDRARAAFYLSKFEEQAQIAKQVLATLPELPNMNDPEPLANALAESPERIEALRWLGDACARLVAARSGGDEQREARGISDGAWALGLAAASPTGDETDWTSYASLFGALGLRRDEVAVLQEGATRFPESNALRTALNGALWAGGRVDLIPVKAEWLLGKNPKSGVCAWHAGYAHLIAAEDARRRERPDESIAAYDQAEQRFRDAIARSPELQDSAEYYLALGALGRGFAHVLAARRGEAAECLAAGIAIRPSIAGQRDGLDREAIDLLDYSLEWQSGKDSPVDPLALLAALEKADPGNAAWARAIADSELREALRAEGRSDRASTKRYLALSIEVGERAVATEASQDSRRTLAQSLAIAADIAFEEGDVAEARKQLAAAAPLLGEAAPAADADEAALRALAAALRERLGAARPRFRPGR